MRERKLLLAGLAFGVVAIVPGFSQQPAPYLPNDPLGPQLIVWTEMQRPQPVPQPKPDPMPLPDPSPDQQQPDDRKPAPPPAASPESQSRDSHQTLEGTIVKDKGRYVLSTHDHTVYQLDDQEKAKPFEGKLVRVVGRIDDQMVLHIDQIQAV
jgi:hypothetical protein